MTIANQYYNSTTMQVWIWILLLPISIVAYVCYHFFIRIYIAAWNYQKMDPSIKVLVSPIFGLLGMQKKNFQKYGDSLRYIKDLARQNPDLKAYATNIGHRPMLILCDAQLVKEYLLQSKKFRKFNLYKHNDISYKQGLFLADEELWARQKAIVKHSFNHQSMKRMIPIMEECIGLFLGRLTEQIKTSEKQSIDFKVLHDGEVVIGEILVGIVFGKGALSKKVKGQPLSIALAESTVEIFHRSRSSSNLFWSLFFGENVAKINFSQKDKDLYNYIIDIRKIIEEIIAQRLTNGDAEQKDFLQVYIDQMRENDRIIAEAKAKGETTSVTPIPQEEVIQQLISFYFAGIDTTGHLVAFALYCLAEYPEHAKTIKEEIRKIFGDSLNNITYENLGKMQFTDHFIDEVLRMWPPATGNLARVAKVDIQIGPFQIKKGSLMGSNILGLMQNPKYYENPEVFDPYRWTKPGAYTKQPYSFIPFSAGPRSCIGKYVAIMQTKLIMIHFLNNFNFQRTDVPLRTHIKFLYEPSQEDLVRLTVGGMQIK